MLQALTFVEDIYPTALSRMSREMNRIHGLSKDEQFYHLVLGNWLVHFMQSVYDRYLVVDKAFCEYPELDTVLLDPAQYSVPWDCKEYNEAIQGDSYNLQLISQIVVAQGHRFPTMRIASLQDNRIGDRPWFRLRCAIVQGILNALLRLLSLGRGAEKTAVFVASYLDRGDLIRLATRAPFRVQVDDFEAKRKVVPADLELRKRIRLRDSEDTGFSAVLFEIMPGHIPTLFVEGFRDMYEPAKRKSAAAVYVTGCALHTFMPFKFFLAEKRRECRVLVRQYGGNCGTDFRNTVQDYEMSVADRYLTWGWSMGAKTKPVTSPGINRSAARTSRQVLMVVSGYSRYLYRMHFHPLPYGGIQANLVLCEQFLEGIRYPGMILVRNSPRHSFGWPVEELFLRSARRRGLDIQFDDFSRKFGDQLARSCLYVGTGMQTTYLQALAANRPTLVLVPRGVYRLNAEAEEYHRRLGEVGILHYDAQSAVEQFQRISERPEEWWSSGRIQEVRRDFCGRYCRTGTEWAVSHRQAIASEFGVPEWVA